MTLSSQSDCYIGYNHHVTILANLIAILDLADRVALLSSHVTVT